jgi:hypothetical protein
MLPKFDEHGNLPPGIHRATLEEVIERFSILKSLKRRSLTNNLRGFFGFIQDFAVGIYIDGSYTTSKLAPNDIDLIVILPSDFVFDSPAGQRLGRIIAQRKTLCLHIFTYVQGRQDQEIQKLIDLFTEDRDGNPKGLIHVEIR